MHQVPPPEQHFISPNPPEQNVDQNLGLEQVSEQILHVWQQRYEFFIQDLNLAGLHNLGLYWGFVYIKPSKEASRKLALKFYRADLSDPTLRHLKADFEDAIYAIAEKDGQTMMAFLNFDFDKEPDDTEIENEMNRLGMMSSKREDFIRLVYLYLKYKNFSFNYILHVTGPHTGI